MIVGALTVWEVDFGGILDRPLNEHRQTSIYAKNSRQIDV